MVFCPEQGYTHVLPGNPLTHVPAGVVLRDTEDDDLLRNLRRALIYVTTPSVDLSGRYPHDIQAKSQRLRTTVLSPVIHSGLKFVACFKAF